MGAYREITDPSGKKVTIWDPSMSSGQPSAPAASGAGSSAGATSSTNAQGNTVVSNPDGSTTTYNRLGATLSSTPANKTGTPASSNVLDPAVKAVQGGGAGSQYSVNDQGQTAYSVTPNNNAFEAEQAALASQRSQAAASALLQQRAQLNQQSMEQQFARLQQMQASNGSSPHVTGAGSNADEEGARNAAFARAKDQAGQVAQAGLAGLRNAYDSRGLTGSSLEKSGAAHEVAGAAGSLGEFTREQLIQALQRAAQLSDRNYQGDITQRGQDLSAQQGLMGLLMSQGALY